MCERTGISSMTIVGAEWSPEFREILVRIDIPDDEILNLITTESEGD